MAGGRGGQGARPGDVLQRAEGRLPRVQRRRRRVLGGQRPHHRHHRVPRKGIRHPGHRLVNRHLEACPR